jgi:ketosteroid isomerase-like protein
VASQVNVVRAAYEAFARRDLDAMLALVDDAVELDVSATAGLARRDGPYLGHAGVRAYFDDVRTTWSELTLEASDFRAAAGGVVVFGSVHGRIGTTEVRRQVVWTWRLKNNLVLAVRANDLRSA